jgi:2-polyprenyl-3-methyl-5-hydroxy-6-metoxy-1,4-benzoquinol methylase
MADQSRHWSRAAATYEEDFIDPYFPGVKNPLPAALAALASSKKTVGDLGCGVGPLLPSLAGQFGLASGVAAWPTSSSSTAV